MKRLSLIFGTRPEAIKLFPLIHAMKKYPNLDAHICVTGQHKELLAQVLEMSEVKPHVNLSLMYPNQTLSDLTSRAIAAIDKYLTKYKPNMVIVQGDTTTAFCASLCAFFHKIPVAHVEAGLRTWNKQSPFPEEINRVLISRIADLHFSPTTSSRDNLIREGVPKDRVIVTGNTVIDALFIALEKVKTNPPVIPGLPPKIIKNNSSASLILITGHRRENFGLGFKNICLAIAELARNFPDTHFIYPVHLNPNVTKPVYKILGNCQNIHLIDPLEYLSFVAIMQRARIVLTDSGGIQEEAPSLGKPVLVMRESTERPEAVAMGTVKLVGTNKEKIIQGVTTLLTDEKAYRDMANAVNPYGDGRATERIVSACLNFFNEREQGH